jgi:hypothetical protein
MGGRVNRLCVTVYPIDMQVGGRLIYIYKKYVAVEMTLTIPCGLG